MYLYHSRSWQLRGDCAAHPHWRPLPEAPPCADLWQQLALPLPGALCAVAPSAAGDGSLFVADRGSGAIKQVSWQQRSWQQAASTEPGKVAPRELGALTVPHTEALPSSLALPLQLRPVSFVRQADQLLGLGEHEEALALAALICVCGAGCTCLDALLTSRQRRQVRLGPPAAVPAAVHAHTSSLL